MENFERIDNYWINLDSPWNMIRGKYLFENSKTLNKDSKESNLLSLTLNGVLNKDMNSGEGLRPDSYDSYQIFQENDLVFKLIDLENVKTSRVGWVHEKGLMSPVYIRLRPKEHKINTRYFYYYFFDLYQKEIFNSVGSGIRSSLSGTNLLELLVPNPSYEEQNQIVDYLDKKMIQIDKLIKKIKQKIELLKEQRTSLINEVVTKGLNPNVEMKDSGVRWFGEVPKHWKISKLKYVSELYRGKFTHRPRNDEKMYGGIYPFIQTGDITSSGKYIETYSQTLNDQGYSVSKEFPVGTIVMTISGNIGDVSILKMKSCFPDSLIGFHPRKEITQDYLYYLFLSMKDELIRNTIKSTQMNLNLDRVGSIKLPLPSIREQETITNLIELNLKHNDDLIFNEEERIKLLKEYKQSLISEVVTGKKRVVS